MIALLLLVIPVIHPSMPFNKLLDQGRLDCYRKLQYQYTHGRLCSEFTLFLSKPQLNHNSTQPNITLSWVRHENDFAYHPTTPHTNSMSAISQMLQTRFQPKLGSWEEEKQ